MTNTALAAYLSTAMHIILTWGLLGGEVYCELFYALGIVLANVFIADNTHCCQSEPVKCRQLSVNKFRDFNSKNIN